MPAHDDGDVMFDMPEVDVDSLASFIRDRMLQRPVIQREQTAAQTADTLSPGEGIEHGPRTPLGRSLLSLSGYLEVLRADLAAVREWQRLEAEQSAGREVRLNQRLDQVADAIGAVAADVAQVNDRMSRLEHDVQEIASFVRQTRADRGEGSMGRLWSRVRSTGR